MIEMKEQENEASIRNAEENIVKYSNRKKTDLCWSWVYCLLTVVVVGTFFYSFILEKDKNLFKPIDPDGRKCGQEQAIQYGYIYFPSPFPQSIDKAVCIKSCPSSFDSKIECLSNSKVKKCELDMKDHFNRSNQFLVYPTTASSILSLCSPSSKILFDALNSKINTYHLFMNLENVYESYAIILIACPIISLLIVTFYVCIITEIEDIKCVFRVFTLMFMTVLLGFSIYCFTNSAKRLFAYLPYFGIALFAIFVLLAFYIIWNYRFYERSIQLLEIGVKYIKNNKGLIVTSIMLFLVWIIVFVLEIFALIFIYSIDSGGQRQEKYSFAYFTGIQNSLFVKILIVLSIIHYFWTNLILYNCGTYVCMTASSFWVLGFQNNFKNALYSLLRFHLGSVIYSSFANTFIGKIGQFFYCFLPNQDSKLFGCCSCKKLHQFYRGNCFRKTIGIYNSLNYIQIGVKGTGVCQSGYNMNKNLVQNINKVQKAYSIAKSVVFISKVLVALATTFICYFIIQVSPNMKGSFITNIIIFIFSSFLTSFAFDSYDRSFEVMLITIRSFNVEQEGNKQINSLISKVTKWFEREENLEKEENESKRN